MASSGNCIKKSIEPGVISQSLEATPMPGGMCYCVLLRSTNVNKIRIGAKNKKAHEQYFRALRSAALQRPCENYSSGVLRLGDQESRQLRALPRLLQTLNLWACLFRDLTAALIAQISQGLDVGDCRFVIQLRSINEVHRLNQADHCTFS